MQNDEVIFQNPFVESNVGNTLHFLVDTIKHAVMHALCACLLYSMRSKMGKSIFEGGILVCPFKDRAPDIGNH
ncbi:hypothetical protein CEXT_564981 [Caerostris extrusa]|uniref:Uncharacterized protein n=1 Tax=Caerostris extrusa TaxID=172846 RepID=A0AAV4MCD2_CAEEX|nr:hypothetical protein CEXT_564981 [Caerostris extrusa]